MEKNDILIGEIQNKKENKKKKLKQNNWKINDNLKIQVISPNNTILVENEYEENKGINIHISDFSSSMGKEITNKIEEVNKESYQINNELKCIPISKPDKIKKCKKRKSKKLKSFLKKPEIKQNNVNLRIEQRNKYIFLNEEQRFEYAFTYFKKHISKLARKYSFPEYLTIDVLMMAIAKIIPKSYTKEYYYISYIGHLKENLIKRYKLALSQYNELENLIEEILLIFQEKYCFSLFRCDQNNRYNIYLPRVYEEFKEIINQNISKFITGFGYKQKVVLWLFNYWNLNNNSCIWSGTLSFIKNCAKIAFSLPDVNEEFVKNTIIDSGIGHFGDYYSSKRGELHNLQKNNGMYYEFWFEIPIIPQILDDIRIPDFSEAIEEFREKFDIFKNTRNILEFIGLEYILNKDYNPSEFLDKIMISGSKIFLDHQKILRNGLINHFIREELNALQLEVKEQLFEKYYWLIDALRTNFNAELDDLIENGKIYYVELNGERYNIEIYPWYTENILFNSNSNRIIIFLFHPKFKFLRETFFNPNLIKGLIAFTENNKVFTIGCSSFHENFVPIFQEFEKRGLKRSSFELSYEEEISEKEEYEEIHSNFSLSQISNPDGEGGNFDGVGSEIWDIFQWDAEKWEKFQFDLNSDTPMCIFLKNKDKCIAEKTILKLISTEFNRKYGNPDTGHEILNFADFEPLITIISSEKVTKYVEFLNQFNSKINSTNLILNNNEYVEFLSKLDDLMVQIDIVRGNKKKLIFFLCDFKSEIGDLLVEVKRRITSTHLLEIKYSKLPDILLVEIINQLCSILSIPSYNWKENILISEEADIDEIFTCLDDIKTLNYRKITDSPNWIYIKPSWSNEDEEHLKMKLLAYNYLNHTLKYQNEDISIEEIYDSEGNGKAIPDINVNREIWVEIETLLGNTDLSLLITEKFQKKKAMIKYFKEFWLVLPNFEIFMHKTKIRTLIKQLYSLFEKGVSIKILGCNFIEKTLIPVLNLKKPNN